MRSVLQGWAPDAKGALKDAEAWAKKAVKLNPNDYAPLWDLAFVYLNTGRFRKAIETYEKAHKLYNDGTDRLDRKPGLLVEMAEAYVHAGESEKGVELIKRAMRCPDWYQWNLGWAYFMARDYDNALEALQKIDLSPSNPQYVPEVRLFIAAAQHRKAEQLKGLNRARAASTESNRAKAAIADFRKDHPEYTKEHGAAARSRFKNREDEEHWMKALEELGL